MQVREVGVLVDDEVSGGRIIVPAYIHTLKLSCRELRKDLAQALAKSSDSVRRDKVGSRGVVP